MSDILLKKIVKYFKRVSFCGTFSDPIFNIHFIDILKICRDENIFTEVHNAASHKPEKWYQEAFLANKNANWIFGIDGLPKDSHKYRKNQDGEFLFDMMLLNKYLGMRPEWQYIVFDYNKDDIEEAKKIAKRHKLKFMLITSKRPVSKDIHNVELKEVKDGKLGLTKSSKKTDGENPNNSYASIDYSTGDWTKRPTSKVEDKKIKANTLKPKCLLTDRDLSYSVTGHILPCCWVAGSMYKWWQKPGENQVWELIQQSGGKDEPLALLFRFFFLLFFSSHLAVIQTHFVLLVFASETLENFIRRPR